MFQWFKGNELQAEKMVMKRFVPQRDITAYEVAYLISKFTAPWFESPSRKVNFTQGQWDQLEPQYKRHFEDIT